MGRGRTEIRPAITAGGQHHHLGVEHMHRAIVQLPRHHTGAAAICDHKIKREVFDIEFRLLLQALAVKRVQNRVPRAICRRTGALHGRAFAVFGGMTTKRALVNLALIRARKWHAVMFQLVHRLRRLTRQIFHRVRITQPVAALDRVIHMPLPAIRPHVAQTGRNPALCRHRMAACREHLGHTGRAQALFRHAKGSAQASAPGPHHNHVVIMRLVCISSHHPSFTVPYAPEQTAPSPR